MPTIDVDQTGMEIPAKVGRKQLIVRNEGSDSLRYGWEATVTNDGTAATDGVLLKVDEVVAFAGLDIDPTGTLKLICASGETATVSYTERA